MAQLREAATRRLCAAERRTRRALPSEDSPSPPHGRLCVTHSPVAYTWRGPPPAFWRAGLAARFRRAALPRGRPAAVGRRPDAPAGAGPRRSQRPLAAPPDPPRGPGPRVPATVRHGRGARPGRPLRRPVARAGPRGHDQPGAARQSGHPAQPRHSRHQAHHGHAAPADVPERDPGERTLALAGLLRRFIDVCNAIAYAHSRCVIHRDIKPSNVMLGPYGETLVVDWGLAKLFDQPCTPESHEVPIVPV